MAPSVVETFWSGFGTDRVGCRRLVETHAVRDDEAGEAGEAGIDLAVLDAAEQRLEVSLHVALSTAHGQAVSATAVPHVVRVTPGCDV